MLGGNYLFVYEMDEWIFKRKCPVYVRDTSLISSKPAKE